MDEGYAILQGPQEWYHRMVVEFGGGEYSHGNFCRMSSCPLKKREKAAGMLVNLSKDISLERGCLFPFSILVFFFQTFADPSIYPHWCGGGLAAKLEFILGSLWKHTQLNNNACTDASNSYLVLVTKTNKKSRSRCQTLTLPQKKFSSESTEH